MTGVQTCALPICETSEIYKQAMSQDFLPVVDDSGTFIGIVTRSRIINHLLSKIK